MLSLVPIILFILLFLIFQKKQVIACWRSSFLSASITWGILLTAMTEVLSLFRSLAFWSILALWVLSAMGASFFLFRMTGNTKTIDLKLYLSSFSRFELVLLGGVVLILFTVGVIGLLSPPNNLDSMTYHMSRVVHWIQNKSVGFYPTHILRQLYQDPLAEYAITHFQILSGSDRFANLIQWFSMVGATLGASLLAKKLGADVRGQVLSSVISVTIPMGILQGSSTQNDYLLSFWLVCLTCFAFFLRENGKLINSLAMGISLGLAILTKATAYIYALPIMIWVGLSLIRRYQIKGVQLLALAAITTVVINIGHYSRNYNLYGNPLGPDQEEGGFKYSNDVFSPASMTSNVIRNIGLHIGTPFDGVNSLLEERIDQLHKVIGMDINDTRTTWQGTKFKIIRPLLREDWAGNSLHLISIFASIFILIFIHHKKWDIFNYTTCLIGGFLLFSLYLKWQPWHSRLHLPLFILWSPLIGFSLSQIKHRWFGNLYCVVFLLGATPYLLYNDARPLIGQQSILVKSRTNLYFANDPALARPYIRSVRLLSKASCSDIGLILGSDDWEYPFWALMAQDGKRTVRFEHVNVTNISQVKYKEYPFNTFIPCAVIVVSKDPPEDIRVGLNTYSQRQFFDPISIYKQK
jgi:4-amino-4-deoxy-L-arabinose transferase-like glycosyltransferase